MDTQPTTQTLAGRKDLAPRAHKLLVQQLHECGGLLDPLLCSTLDDLETELFRIAEQSSGGQAQHEALDALKHIKQARPRFQPRLMAALEHRFAELGRAANRTGAGDGRAEADLALVDPRELDESMAMDDLSARTELHASNAIFDLCHRYAVLVAVPPLENDALPPGPHMLTAALGEAATDLGLEREHRLLFYRLCDRRLFAAAESLYARLNEHLKAAGILPHLRSYLPRRRPSARRSPADAAPAPPEAPADADVPITPVTVFTPPAGPAPASPQELHGLLDARRRALHPDAAAAAPGNLFASMPELQEALAALEALPSRKQAGPQRGERLSGDLLTELRRSAHGEPVQLQPAHRDAVDLIGLLYDQLLTETRAEGVAQQLLGSLQVPLLSVALSDEEFFTVRNHPARRLLNLVLETANLWLDRSDERFDAALNQRLHQAVEHVAREYRNDTAVFEREADNLDSHMHQLKRRAEIAERRQVEAAQGRDRLREARAAAAKAIDKRLVGRKTTPLVRALLENAWTDALTLTLLREGEQSDAYRRRLATADQLLKPSSTRDEKQLAADLNLGLSQVGLQAGEADQITRYALDLPQRSGPRAPVPSQTELLIGLKARHKADADEAAPAAPAAPRKLALTPSERRALDTLKKLPFGSWLEFTVNQQGQKVARKLAWHNPGSGRCLLVNARGAAAPERSLEQVARLLARGQARLLPAQDGGMLDRAWNALVAGLRKFGRLKPIPESAT